MPKLRKTLAYVVMIGYLITTALLFTSLAHAEAILWDLPIFLVVVGVVGFLVYEREGDNSKKEL